MKRAIVIAMVLSMAAALVGTMRLREAGAATAAPSLVWPKNSKFDCRGIVIQEDGSYQLRPDAGMLAWYDADIDDEEAGRGTINRLLEDCKLGEHCRIRGTIKGHGAFFWIKIISVQPLR
jgi:hypothetical protein